MIVRALPLLALAVSACRRSPPPPPAVAIPTLEIPVEPPWPRTLTAVLAAADSGQFAAADSMLVAFAAGEAGTPAASESAFWRALLRADPRNPAFSPAEARAALETHLASPAATRRTEAGVLLRLLGITDSLRTAHASARLAAEQRDRARDEELHRLRDELQRTQAELERIKRRLGPPKP